MQLVIRPPATRYRHLADKLAALTKVARLRPPYVLVCARATKDDEVVEYTLSRAWSPTLLAEYQTQLSDKKLLEAKLHEFYLQNERDEQQRDEAGFE